MTRGVRRKNPVILSAAKDLMPAARGDEVLRKHPSRVGCTALVLLAEVLVERFGESPTRKRILKDSVFWGTNETYRE
jgi:hypothetical protein